MRRLSLGLVAAIVLSVGVSVTTPTLAEAAAGSGCNPNATVCPPDCGGGNSCNISVTNPPSPPSTTPPAKGGSGGGSAPCTDSHGAPVPCYDPLLGWYSQGDHCYYAPANPPPPPTDPAWQGHYPSGALYDQTCEGTGAFGGGLVWLASPPQGATVTPAQLAQQALATLTLPTPVMRRSPTEANSDNGQPYTWVHLWTWFWTDSASWTPLTARAAAGPVWAQVTVTPTRLIITPGEAGATDVSCPGPGRPWTAADGNAAPSNGGCAYAYQHVAASPLRATETIEWSVTWQGSGGTGGTLPVMRTQASASFLVEQIQVVTR